ncbi:M23 family metallopeptidase [Propylenella binzhouense]|uniref:M23 family peptidase n=1 Tax=Propylenella binzhouense TaxID=2555902 RepID=A0A964T2G5_9HYPH|nr:M23 family metallopeptidase [Propylenella binzhouense]MYZ47188.1 M23 family peptidase [Propylenella binzhouense]
MIHPTQQTRPFGRRKELPRVSITRGGKTATYVLRPWVFGTVVGTFLMFGVGYVGATAYLLYRDDLLGTAAARQHELEDEYEERIARLRSEIDRVTSKHLVESQGVEEQIGFLIDRQEVMEHRQAVLDQIIGKARRAGLGITAGTAPKPVPKPNLAASTAPEPRAAAPMAYVPSDQPAADIITGTVLRKAPADALPASREGARRMLKDVQSKIDRSESLQVATIEALGAASEAEIERLSGVLTKVGLPGTSTDMGGPFVPAKLHFVDRLQMLGRTLDEITKLRSRVASVPLSAPIPGAEVTSGFGYRDDPFLRRPAMHAGIDFRAGVGTEVHATAPGKVIFAGWNGGYGRCIEIQHTNGITTRYGHLSAILVEKGDQVETGSVIGRVGSTGRSTGPHLHYETRRSGDAVDPRIYLAAGGAI